MEQRVSLITLGAKDMDALAGFYDALGWQRIDTPDAVIAYDLICQTLGLYPLDKLAEDIGVPLSSLGYGACTFAHNLRTKEEVAPLVAKAEAAGAKILKPAQDVFWGGHHAYFADPEGHIWEIAYNPFSPLRADGAFRWTGYGEG
ncbi:VOC family protein [Roseobacter sp. YSTF-M11]|uniref:VOC family protein n=1 Tax=Roseobacter insulae TaxID=2859783 RepID=A0A9X1K096_9RHOB|nr:VOC family protein [Roseobacter insulae]MBW4710281.1 VOC family protein [Roseobacter insulae]